MKRRSFRRWMVLAAGLLLPAVVAARLAWDVATLDLPLQLSAQGAAPLRILDREGRLLRAVPSPARPARAAWVKLDQVSSTAVLTLLASEDQRFFEHAGVDPWAVLRALVLDVKTRSFHFGASTLSMQLVRMIAPQAVPRTLWGKLVQAAGALWLEARFDKRTLLEHYLNRAPFGHNAIGLEAAAQLYFDTPAASLADAQAILLMVLPRGPAHYDLIRHRDRALARRDHLLGLLVQQGRLSLAQARSARLIPGALALHAPRFAAPHFVDWVLSELPQGAAARGGDVRTTLDAKLQEALEHRTREHVTALRERGAEQSGVVVLATPSAEVLAMVGSSDYAGLDGQLNISTWRRHPGSALKPFIYAAAIEAGASPASVVYDVYDVPSAYQVRGRIPVERGPVRMREALAGSYNLAAVHTLESVGLTKGIELLRRAGAAELAQQPDAYGLRLALGSAQVRLVDLAASYGAFVRGGQVLPVRSLLSWDGGGVDERLAPGAERRVMTPSTAWLVMDMLSDPAARRPRFGDELALDLPYRVAAKTGTARGFSDTVAVIVTRELTVAAWTGRFDGRATQGLSGMRGAAWLARAALLVAAQGRSLTLPERPPEVAPSEVCPLSGMAPGPHCPHRKVDFARADSAPRAVCTWHRAAGQIQYPAELAGWAERSGVQRLLSQR